MEHLRSILPFYTFITQRIDEVACIKTFLDDQLISPSVSRTSAVAVAAGNEKEGNLEAGTAKSKRGMFGRKGKA